MKKTERCVCCTVRSNIYKSTCLWICEEIPVNHAATVCSVCVLQSGKYACEFVLSTWSKRQSKLDAVICAWHARGIQHLSTVSTGVLAQISLWMKLNSCCPLWRVLEQIKHQTWRCKALSCSRRKSTWFNVWHSWSSKLNIHFGSTFSSQ